MFRCPFCGEVRRIADRTKEHIPGKQFYPSNTPATAQRITVNGCRSCNKRFEPIEERVFIGLASCVDPDHPAAAGIHDRFMSRLTPEQASDDVEARARSKRRGRFLDGIVILQEGDQESMSPFPVLDEVRNDWVPTPAGVLVRGRVATKCDAAAIRQFIAKCVRGLFWKHLGRAVSAASTIRSFVPGRKKWAEFESNMRAWRHMLRGVGPGFEYRWWQADDVADATIWEFTLWGQIRFYGTTMPTDHRAVSSEGADELVDDRAGTATSSLGTAETRSAE